jgi:transposase
MEELMDAIVERCAGLDVHQATVVACLTIGAANAKPTKEIRTFGTMLPELEELRDWLKAAGCTVVAMESTGVYWKPVHAVLEGHFELVVGNAHHIKNVPGRKTDVKDCEWVSDLGRHGLIAKSFVPPRPIRDLRDLTRYRCKLMQTQASERNRLIKLLESANPRVKRPGAGPLAGVASDVFGVSGWAMLRALIEGRQTPAEMAQLARGRMRRKLRELEQALTGRLEEHHRFLLGVQMRRIEAAEADLAELDKRLREKLAPYTRQMRLLMQIPGVDWIIAGIIIAEIGVDMSVFHSAEHLASWATVCPGNYQSAGKRHGGKTRKGNVHLKTALVIAGNAAGKTRDTYLGDKYHRLKARRGAMRAAVAIGHKILVAAYHMISTGADYKELGAGYLDQLNTRRSASNMVRRLRQMGYDVQISPRAA